MANSTRKTTQFSSIASLIGEPARATMLWKLLEGKAYTATELAISADISPQSASMHLAKLVKAELISAVSQGRHKYYRLAGAEVAYVLESISNLIPSDMLVTEDAYLAPTDIKYCRTCYDHLAGRVAVALTDRLQEKKIIRSDGQDFDVTTKGIQWFSDLGIAVPDLKMRRRVFARKCLDWSERRYHLSGSLGASLLDKMFEQKWLRRIKDTRRVSVTEVGQTKLYQLVGLHL